MSSGREMITVRWADTARVGVGLLLLVSGVFKTSSSVPLWFSAVVPWAPQCWMLAVLMELLLGFVLVTGIGWNRGTWCFCLMMFGMFATIAGVLTVRGESTCGCLGRVPLRPWGAAILDVCAIALLMVARRGVPSGVRVTAFCAVRMWLAGAVLFAAPVWPAAWVIERYGEPLIVDNPIVVAYGERGTWVPFRVCVHNRSAKRVMIYGAPAPRHVHLLSVLPLVIEPQKNRILEFELFCGGSRGTFSTRLHLLTDVMAQREVMVHVRGGVR